MTPSPHASARREVKDACVRLADRGLLESKWEPAPDPGRPPRHLYRLTAKGSAYARSELEADEVSALNAPEGSRA